MNERVEDLAKEHFCRVEYDNGSTHECYEFSLTELKKFAELIVRECIAQCNDGDSRWFIAQHFGVEE